MTAATAAPDAAPRARAASPYRRTFPRALRSEAIKLVSLRSTWWSIGIVAVLTLGLAVLIAQTMDPSWMDPIQAVVAPIQFTMLLAGILGAIVVTGEYATGMIRSTLTADPVRGSVLGAKAVVVAGFLFLTALATFLLAALIVTPIFQAKDVAIDWGTPAESMLPLLAASLSMAVFGLLGLSFGFLLRSGAGAIAATVGVLFVLPIVFSIFSMPDPAVRWIGELGQYLPMSAAQSAINPQDSWGLNGPTAYLTLGCWAAAGLLSAWAVLRTRDA